MKAGLAEPLVRRLAVRADPADLLRALAGAEPSTGELDTGGLDTGVLVCLAGRWAGGSALIGWDPVRQVDDVRRIGAGRPDPRLDGDARQDGQPAGESPGRPVGGGWIGWSGYSGPSWFGYFPRLLRRAPDGHWWLEALDGAPDEHARLAGLIERLAGTPAAGRVPRIDGLTGTAQHRHLAAVERAITAIRAGQLYQVNVCARFAARLTGSPVELFAAGLRRWAPDYAAFLRTPDRTLVSFSPELFLHRDGDRVRTAPIKGTRRRLGHPGPDAQAAADLIGSAKERAENVMIVDLMRNDLSRVCRPGTVETPSLLDVRPAPGVWHLVSEVTGRLAPGTADADLLAACFPPGSVTGAPKSSALRLITELEDAGRGAFTGAIGYLGPGVAEFNVAIRTFEISGDRLELGAGGGVTAASVPMQEWQECLVKAAPLLELGGAAVTGNAPAAPPPRVRAEHGVIETVLAVDGQLVALADHLDRLAASCAELYRLRLPDELPALLAKAVVGTAGRLRVRLRWGPGMGQPEIEVAAAGAASGPVALHRHPGRTGSWRHKWADRDWLAAQERPGSLPLFTEPGEDGTELALETSRANLAIVGPDATLRTPELGEAVLPGITRRRLLDAAFDRGRPVVLGPVRLAELHTARLVLSLSSIAGVVAVGSLDGQALAVDRPLLAELAGWLA